MLPASSGWRIALGLVGISFWVAPMRLLLPLLARSQIGGLLLTSRFLLALSIDAWSAEVSYPVVSQPLRLACWIDTPDGSSSSVSRAVQDAWDIYREELGVVPPDVVLAIRDAVAGSSVFFGRGEVCCAFVADVLEAELLVAGDLVGV